MFKPVVACCIVVAAAIPVALPRVAVSQLAAEVAAAAADKLSRRRDARIAAKQLQVVRVVHKAQLRRPLVPLKLG